MNAAVYNSYFITFRWEGNIKTGLKEVGWWGHAPD